MIYELSRDYARAWELIQNGEKLACWVDRDISNRGIAYACHENWCHSTKIQDYQTRYFYVFDQEHGSDVFTLFSKKCKELNIEFYLPLADNMIVISEERCEEIIGYTETQHLIESLGSDAPKTYSDLLIETQPQVIISDEQNAVNLAHIERFMNAKKLTPEEERILDLLLLLSGKFEDEAYPMKSPWYSMLWYRVQAFIFRW
jgi:hypothetical protein